MIWSRLDYLGGSDYCEPHDNLLPCEECAKSRKAREAQARHEESVARQRGKLKIAPWRIEASQD